MVACEYDKDVAGDIMGWKLPSWQALLVHRVLPSCGGLLVYVTLICHDFAIIYEHVIGGDNGLASFSFALIIIPAILTLVFTLASPPEGLKTDEETIAIDIGKQDVWWILLQIVNFLFFPFAVIGRYSHQIFWWIETVFASYADDDARTKDAVMRAREPSPVELYLFLQAFLHSAPNVIVNLLDMMSKAENPNFEKLTMQSVSLIFSTLRMASTATLYRRFEREKICGRQYPWTYNTEPLLDNIANEKLEEEIKKSQTLEEFGPIEPSEQEEESEYDDHEERLLARYSQILESDDSLPSTPPLNVREPSATYSDGSEECNKPLTIIDRVAPRRRNTEDTIDSTDVQPPSVASSGHEYVRPRSFIGRLTPQRKSTHYTIEVIDIPPPPEVPASRIWNVWAERLVENAEALPSRLSAPPRSKYVNEVIQEEPDMPVRVPRSYMRGLQPQDATAALMHFLGWHMFFVGRLISIAAFINLFPVVATILLFSHYQVMLLFLIVPQASSIRRGFYLFLAFIYLFCLMEFKIRFRHVRVWHVFWIIVCTLETIIFTSLWASIDNSLSDWWREYAVMVVFGSTLLSYMCMLVYFVLLKPKETKIYFNELKKPIKNY